MGKGDIGDRGNDAAELFQREALSKRKPEGPKAVGLCLACHEPLPPGHRLPDLHGSGHLSCGPPADRVPHG